MSLHINKDRDNLKDDVIEINEQPSASSYTIYNIYNNMMGDIVTVKDYKILF